MKSKRDYYEVLNVSRNATEKEIKRSFRRLAKKYHPDVSSGDSSRKYNDKKFKEINEANEVLSDKNKRSAYDMFGHSAGASQSTFSNRQKAGGFGNFNFDDLFGSFNTGFNFEDIFSNFGKQQTREQQSYDTDTVNTVKSYNLNLNFYVIFRGTNINLDLVTKIKCQVCLGTGALARKFLIFCRACAGKGVIIQQIGGFFQTQIKCPSCRGKGKKIIKRCNKCHGCGVEDNKLSVSINIPGGILPGTVLQKTVDAKNNIVARFGIHYLKSEIFDIDQQFNLIASVQVHFIKALLGGYIEIPNPHNGEFIEISIPPNTTDGSIFTVENVNGIPYKSKDMFGSAYQKYSDYYIKVVLNYPKYRELTNEERGLLKEAAKIHDSKLTKRYQNSFLHEYKNKIQQ